MTEHDENLKRYLVQLATLQRRISQNDWLYHGVEDMVLQLGKFDVVQPRPKGVRRGKARLCFMNAFHLMNIRDGYTYVEGIAMPSNTLFPVHHGWCVDESGKVVDPTWKDGAAYCGIHLNTTFVLRRVLKKRTYGVLGDRDSFDLYRSGLPQDALRQD